MLSLWKMLFLIIHESGESAKHIASRDGTFFVIY